MNIRKFILNVTITILIIEIKFKLRHMRILHITEKYFLQIPPKKYAHTLKMLKKY